MILVTGATGQLGSVVIDFLLQQLPAAQVAALSRDAQKAAPLEALGVDVRIGSYDDPAALDRAMQGIERVLLISGTDEHHRVRQHQHVVDAAKKAGVRCLAYTSRALKYRTTLANRLMEDHFQTEDYIKASGLGYALFRNILYLDVLPFYVGADGLTKGLHLPAGQGQVPYALRREMGEAIANWLATGPCDNTTYVLTGSRQCSFADVAAGLSALTGKEVTYTPVENTAFEALMQERGAPALMAQRIMSFLVDIKNGQEEDVTNDLENLLGRKPASLHEGLKAVFKL